MALNQKQKLFCEEYIKNDFNGTKAAICAGYTASCASVTASKFLRNTNINNYIKEMINARNNRVHITQDDVLRDIIKLKNRCLQSEPVERFDKEIGDFVPVTDEEGRNIWKFDSQGAAKALDMLAKHTGIYEIDNNQKTGVNITFSRDYE